MIVVGDLHNGLKYSTDEFIKYQKNEFDKLISYCKDNSVKNIIFAGDVFHDRKQIHLQTLQIVKDQFNKLSSIVDWIYVIAGNHDCFFKNTNILNTPRETLSHIHNLTIIDNDILEIEIENHNMILVPWMNTENYDYILNKISNSLSDYCIGHFDINGFIMNGSTVSNSSLMSSTFANFKLVLSGHFHTKSKKNNIIYLGSFIQDNWSSYGDIKGFYELINNDINFIESETTIFHKINIKNKFKWESVSEIKNSYLKIYINKKLTKKDKLNLSILISNNINHEIIDNTILSEVTKIDLSNESIEENIGLCIDNQENIEYKKELKDFLLTMYTEMKDN